MLEYILRFAIERRVLVVFVTLVLALGGGYCLTQLPIDAVPDITNNQVQINTLSPSLSPNEVEKQITFPIETALAGIPGLSYTRSLSRNGFSQVTAVFQDEVNIYFARQQVSERLTEARESLPAGAEPRMGAISTGLGEIYMWTVEYEHREGTAATKPTNEPGWQADESYLTPEGERLSTPLERAAYLRTVQDWIIRPQLKGVLGVAGVDTIGGYVKQFHIQPDPRKLVAYGLTFHDLIEALEQNNLSTGAGYIEHNGEAYTVRATGRIATFDQIGSVVVGEEAGTPVYVRDVAWVGMGKELRTGSASENGEEVVVGTALMLIGENSRTVAHAVDQKIQAINKTLPAGIRAKTVLDRTTLVDATIHTVERNLTEGAVLVIVVLLLLLGNFRAALITAAAIPLSMLLTAIGMVQTRTSGNLMSLGAIDFGLIVDGAVIIVENCLRLLAERHHAVGRVLRLRERLDVTLEASQQVLGPAVAGGAIIITVYVPLLFLTGVEGKMFRPMAITVILALVAAFVLAFTFIPAMVALCIRGRVQEKENVAVAAAKRVYEPTLRWVLRARVPVLGAATLMFGVSLWLFGRLGQEFVPTLSELDIAVQAIRIPSTGLTQSSEMQFDVERVVRDAAPEAAFAFSKTGTAEMAADPMPANASDTFVILKPRADWPDPHVTKEQVRERIEQALTASLGNNYEFTQPIAMRFNELIAGVRGDVAVKVFGDDFDALLPAAERIAGILRSTRGAADVRVEQISGLPVLSIDVDRTAIARYGLSVADVQEVVSIAIGGRAAGKVFEGDRRFDIVVRLPEDFRKSIRTLENLPIPLRHDGAERGGVRIAEQTNGFAFIPLSSVARVVVTEGPNQISRENGKRRVVVQANVRGRDIGSFVADAEGRIGTEVKLPAGTWLTWGGQFENLVAAKQRLALVVPACFLVIFLLLYSTFGSARFAAMVFTGVPLALSGGIFSLWLRDMPFSISAAVGFIALSGVAVLNGLVMLTFIKQLRDGGLELDDAINQGALTRLRPVLMTALVASLGFIPMALATGTGAEVQRPLATVVIGGLVTSTALTLLVLPALYRVFAGARLNRNDDTGGRDETADRVTELNEEPA